MIDIIIPTYNRVAALEKVFDSYMAQPELGCCIIVDDCSTDTTEEWVWAMESKYPGKIIYHKPTIKTPMPDLRNIGITLSKSDYIFMGEDDVLLPANHFGILLQNMEKYGADIIAGRRIDLYEGQTYEQAIQNANQDTAPMFMHIPYEAYFDRFIETAQPVLHLHSNALMKRKIFNTLQYDRQFGEQGFVFREETDFFLRAHHAGFSLWIIPDTVSFHLKKMKANKTGGSRRPRLVFEYLVWRNTVRLMLKNKSVFKKELGVRNIYWFIVKCLVARYPYALKRRIMRYIQHHATT